MHPSDKPTCDGKFYMIAIINEEGTITYVKCHPKCETPCINFQRIKKLFAIGTKVE